MRSEYNNGKKILTVEIESNINTESWDGISDEELETFLDTLKQAEKAIVMLRAKIKKVPVISSKPLKPGLTPIELREKVAKWFGDDSALLNRREVYGWDSIYIKESTGDVAYTKWAAEPEDDGYIKGFQLALDPHTNKMIARNCDNIWVSMEKRGYKRVESLTHFDKFYKRI
jgi:hypothetical protein